MTLRRMECFRLLFDHLAWIEHLFLSGVRDSRKVGSLWGMMRGVRGVRKLIHQSWLAKGVGLGLITVEVFREFRKRFRRKTPALLNRLSGISTGTMHQSTTPYLSQTIWARYASRHFLKLPIVQALLPVTFGYFLSSEAVVMRQLRRWKRLWQRSLKRSHKRTSMRPSNSYSNCATRALKPEEIT